MKHVTLSLGFLLAAGLALGCTPSPEKVCNHFFDLEEEHSKESKKDKDDLDPKLEKLIEKIREKKKTECPVAMAALKSDESSVYKCFAKCITATKDYEVAKKCDETCDGFKDAWKQATKKASADDDTKKKASSDDESEDEDTPKKKKKKKAAEEDE